MTFQIIVTAFNLVATFVIAILGSDIKDLTKEVKQLRREFDIWKIHQ